MTAKTSFKNIDEFLYQEGKIFIVPDYQRGYKWSVREKDNGNTAVEQLMIDLINAEKNQQYFLQGVTVVEENNRVILIDGQQRTTTLYLLLWCMGNENISEIDMQYEIRQKSKDFICGLKYKKDDIEPTDENDTQDIYYFKKAIEQIKEKLPNNNEDRQELKEFVLSKVTILYIVIEQDKATKTFTMMNGSKATMLQEELVKAEMLRRISLPDKSEKIISVSVDEDISELKEIFSNDWEINSLRSRYAREWDKWLYWWNREDVKDFFGVENPLGLLLIFYNWMNNIDDFKNVNSFAFEDFKKMLSEDREEKKKQKVKLVFKELRNLQKSFEDVFDIPKVHNYLKMSLLCSFDQNDKFEIIKYFMYKKNEKDIFDDYAKWRLVGASHRQITKTNDLREDEETKVSRALYVLHCLSSDFVYHNYYDLAIKQLLRLNVEEDNKLKRKFDFSIWKNKSIEHIFPKSKVYHRKEEMDEEGTFKTIYFNGNDDLIGETIPNRSSWINRDDFNNNGTEHCIGNLLLLYGKENSEFGAKCVNEKKKTYFNIHEEFKSRHLLHTISVFASDNWGIKEITENKRTFILKFEEDYNVKLNNNANYE